MGFTISGSLRRIESGALEWREGRLPWETALQRKPVQAVGREPESGGSVCTQMGSTLSLKYVTSMSFAM